MQIFWGPCANRSCLVFGEQGVPGSFWHCMSLARSVSMPLFAARNITRILSDILCVLWSLNAFCTCSLGNKGAVEVVRHVANVYMHWIVVLSRLFHENLRKLNENRWTYIKIFENPRKSIKINKNQLNQEKSLKIHEN